MTLFFFHSFGWIVVVEFALYAGFVKFLVRCNITPTCKLTVLGHCLVNKAPKEDLKILNALVFSNTFNCIFFSRNFNHRKCSKTMAYASTQIHGENRLCAFFEFHNKGLLINIIAPLS